MLKNVVRSLNFVVDRVLPVRCMACGEVVSDQAGVCATCWGNLTFVESPYCQVCGHPFEHHIEDVGVCAGCLTKHPPYTLARACFVYNEASRGMLLRFKHSDETYLAPYFATWLTRLIRSNGLHADMVIPVPLHWKRLFSRKYNQAALIASHLADQLNITFDPFVLKRQTWTESQGHLSRKHRKLNVKGAFQVPDNLAYRLSRKRVILVDDVLTTGATIDECAKILKKAGAWEVYVMTVGRVVNPSVL